MGGPFSKLLKFIQSKFSWVRGPREDDPKFDGEQVVRSWMQELPMDNLERMRADVWVQVKVLSIRCGKERARDAFTSIMDLQEFSVTQKEALITDLINWLQQLKELSALPLVKQSEVSTIDHHLPKTYADFDEERERLKYRGASIKTLERMATLANAFNQFLRYVKSPEYLEDGLSDTVTFRETLAPMAYNELLDEYVHQLRCRNYILKQIRDEPSMDDDDATLRKEEKEELEALSIVDLENLSMRVQESYLDMLYAEGRISQDQIDRDRETHKKFLRDANYYEVIWNIAYTRRIVENWKRMEEQKRAKRKACSMKENGPKPDGNKKFAVCVATEKGTSGQDVSDITKAELIQESLRVFDLYLELSKRAGDMKPEEAEHARAKHADAVRCFYSNQVIQDDISMYNNYVNRLRNEVGRSEGEDMEDKAKPKPDGGNNLTVMETLTLLRAEIKQLQNYVNDLHEKVNVMNNSYLTSAANMRSAFLVEAIRSLIYGK